MTRRRLTERQRGCLLEAAILAGVVVAWGLVAWLLWLTTGR